MLGTFGAGSDAGRVLDALGEQPCEIAIGQLDARLGQASSHCVGVDVTQAVSELAKGGPVHSQADGVVKLLHSDKTAIHLVTLLEALPIQESVEAIDELTELGLPIGSVIVNRNIPAYLDANDLAKAAEGAVDADAVRSGLAKVGITLGDDDFAGLLTETIQHATRIGARAECAAQLDAVDIPRLELPAISDGVDLGSLYELAEALAQQGVR